MPLSDKQVRTLYASYAQARSAEHAAQIRREARTVIVENGETTLALVRNVGVEHRPLGIYSRRDPYDWTLLGVLDDEDRTIRPSHTPVQMTPELAEYLEDEFDAYCRGLD